MASLGISQVALQDGEKEQSTLRRCDSQSKSSTTISLGWIRPTGALGCKPLAQGDWLREANIASVRSLLSLLKSATTTSLQSTAPSLPLYTAEIFPACQLKRCSLPMFKSLTVWSSFFLRDCLEGRFDIIIGILISFSYQFGKLKIEKTPLRVLSRFQLLTVKRKSISASGSCQRCCEIDIFLRVGRRRRLQGVR